MQPAPHSAPSTPNVNATAYCGTCKRALAPAEIKVEDCGEVYGGEVKTTKLVCRNLNCKSSLRRHGVYIKGGAQ